MIVRPVFLNRRLMISGRVIGLVIWTLLEILESTGIYNRKVLVIESPFRDIFKNSCSPEAVFVHLLFTFCSPRIQYFQWFSLMVNKVNKKYYKSLIKTISKKKKEYIGSLKSIPVHVHQMRRMLKFQRSLGERVNGDGFIMKT